MHGFLWSWHHSHHKVHTHTLERNDLFAIVFSIPSITCIYIGVYYAELYWVLAIGIGIFLYGVFYLIFHDIIVHRRIPIRFKTQNKYMKRIRNAHYTHHKTHTKEGAEAFGFLYAPKNTIINLSLHYDPQKNEHSNNGRRCWLSALAQ